MANFSIPFQIKYYISSWSVGFEIEVSRNGVYRVSGYLMTSTSEEYIELNDLDAFFTVCAGYGINLRKREFSLFGVRFDQRFFKTFFRLEREWIKIGLVDKEVYIELQSQTEYPVDQPRHPFMPRVTWNLPKRDRSTAYLNLKVEVIVSQSSKKAPPIQRVEAAILTEEGEERATFDLRLLNPLSSNYGLLLNLQDERLAYGSFLLECNVYSIHWKTRRPNDHCVLGVGGSRMVVIKPTIDS